MIYFPFLLFDHSCFQVTQKLLAVENKRLERLESELTAAGSQNKKDGNLNLRKLAQK
jgi:hypothetical protein